MTIVRTHNVVGFPRCLRAPWIILAAVLLSFGQTTAKKETAPSTKKTAPPAAKPDTWQKSKECATQAEKTVATWYAHPAEWKNHYSPKYDKCFVSLSFLTTSQDEKIFPTLFETVLVDAFERSPVANTCTVLGHSDCVEEIVKTGRYVTLDSVSRGLNGKPFAEASVAEQEATQKIADKVEREAPRNTSNYCGIDGKAVGCKEAADSISEHMKN